MDRTLTVRAPGRVNLIGEHTDYNAGLCLPVAIPAATTARATVLDQGPTRIASAQQDDTWSGVAADAAPGRVDGWAAYAAGVLWALEQAGYVIPPLDLALDSTVPLGAGLSSSASLEAAVAVAAVTAAGLDLDDDLRRALVEACRRAETEVAGAPTGGLDQSAVLLARDGHALLLDFADGSAEHVPVDVGAAGLQLLVVDTRVSHALTDGGYGSRRDQCEEAARRLGVGSLRESTPADVATLDDDLLRRRATHVVSENTRVEKAVHALRAGDWAELGRLFTASHLSLRDDFEVSCAELDLVVDTALQTGALGARMTGGGFGGSAIALVPAERADAVRRAVDVAFVRGGLAAPGHLDGTPSAGAAPV
ncbi:galactokinase [Nocardioides sp.]|uniref:galactokinase n=1 Tax=Nocardioides sp. TaxID=35761 RepID=UPI00271D362A|nr:galactokinase [Nocardioides sp.]MDO9457031.1 galactokinase [Nocardioides sp.]